MAMHCIWSDHFRAEDADGCEISVQDISALTRQHRVPQVDINIPGGLGTLPRGWKLSEEGKYNEICWK